MALLSQGAHHDCPAFDSFSYDKPFAGIAYVAHLHMSQCFLAMAMGYAAAALWALYPICVLHIDQVLD